MKKSKIIVLSIVALLIAAGIIGIKNYVDSHSYQSTFASPTGEYYILMRYTDAFSIGYHGSFYLFANGEKHLINNSAPDGCKWISDKEFTTGGAGSITGMCKYNVDDVIAYGAEKAEVMIYPPLSYEPREGKTD